MREKDQKRKGKQKMYTYKIVKIVILLTVIHGKEIFFPILFDKF